MALEWLPWRLRRNSMPTTPGSTGARGAELVEIRASFLLGRFDGCASSRGVDGDGVTAADARTIVSDARSSPRRHSGSGP